MGEDTNDYDKKIQEKLDLDFRVRFKYTQITQEVMGYDSSGQAYLLNIWNNYQTKREKDIQPDIAAWKPMFSSASYAQLNPGKFTVYGNNGLPNMTLPQTVRYDGRLDGLDLLMSRVHNQSIVAAQPPLPNSLFMLHRADTAKIVTLIPSAGYGNLPLAQ
jgi:hypothetical protein